jgi:hypothetical protein
VARRPAVHRWRGLGEVCGKTIYDVQLSCCYTGTKEGRLGRGSSPGVLETAETGGVDEGNRHENLEELPGLVLQLQRKKEHMRRCTDQATGDERHGDELSPTDGGRRWRDPRWRPEE